MIHAFIYHDKKFEFEDKRFPLGGPSFCELDVLLPDDWAHRVPSGLVMFTDPGKSCGVSVTNGSEVIAQKIWETVLKPQFGPGNSPALDPAGILWVERYRPGPTRPKETLDQIRYAYVGSRFFSPRWSPIGRPEIERQFGQEVLA